MNIFVTTIALSFFIQCVFFAYAAIRKTDLVTDLSYSITFIVLAIFCFITSEFNILKMILLFTLITWAVRLGGYLFIRIRKIKRDKRFDGIRENFWKFARFWILQAVSVWIIMLGSINFLAKEDQNIETGLLVYIGLFVSILGIVIEALADYQQFKFRNNPSNRNHWTDIGLWKYSRHPNYFGEMLVWWGIFLFTFNSIKGLEFLTILSPLYITILLLFVTGIPTTEGKNNKRYGGNKEYIRHKKNTGLIVPKIAFP